MATEKKAQAAAAGATGDAGTTSATASTLTQPSGKPTFTRRFPRFVIDVRLQVKMFQAGEFRQCWGRSTEMGQDGIGATLTGSLEPGEIVTLEMHDLGYVEPMTNFHENHPMDESVSWEQACSIVAF